MSSGERMIAQMRRLFPICRSITGNGVRQSLEILRETIPGLTRHEVPTGTKCFDWTIPDEWNVRSATLTGPDGTVIASLAQNTLHLVSYSEPVDREIGLDELQAHLHSVPDQPDAIPYVTAYFTRTWGFCLADRVRSSLQPGAYRVHIDSTLAPGSMTYGELYIRGEIDDEVLLSTYTCHPQMANNELSGPCLAAELGAWLASQPRRLSYRILFVPETIGAVCYLSRHLDDLKRCVIAGFVLTCVGDERTWSFMPSRDGDTRADRAARHVLAHAVPRYDAYTFLQRGSDERQYCSPGVDLPVCSIMRSKYVTYPEYHTSLDNFDLVTARGMEQSFDVHRRLLEAMEADRVPRARVLGEPKMSDRGLRPPIGKLGSANSGRTMMNLLAYSDGRRSLVQIADVLGVPIWELAPIASMLESHELLELH